MRITHSFFCLTLAVVLCAGAARGAQSLLLSNATVHTVSGQTLAPGQVLIKDGKIAAVSRQVPAGDHTVIDLAGQHLYPGMIALNTVLGLTEIGSVRGTEDMSEVGEFTPDVESWIAVNPDSELIPVARANGIALFEPVPQGGVVSGQSALLASAGWTSEQMVVHQPMALHVFWPALDLDTTPKEKARGKKKLKPLEEQAKERRVKLQALVDFFDEAKAYAKARQVHGASGLVPAWEAMLPFVSGQRPIVVHADEVRQIRTAVTWAASNGFKIILAGGRDAARVAPLLRSKQIPVIYEHVQTQPARDTDPYDRPFATPQILHEAGVKVALSIGSDSFNAPLIKNLPYSAAQAVGLGLSPEAAIKMITLFPAEIAGVADRFGSIEPGKEATLFVCDGDILDARANVTRMWIAGRETDLQSRHTRLYEKYKHRPR